MDVNLVEWMVEMRVGMKVELKVGIWVVKMVEELAL